MIGYVNLGTNDIDKAAAFYDALTAVMGGKRAMQGDHFIVWNRPDGGASLSIIKPHDGKAATVGNGVMVAIQVADKEMVHKVYDKAIELGGTDEGPAGPRGDEGFYAGYFRDLDGNKLNVFCF